MYILLDFDGTCVTHEYPYIGKDIGAVPVLQRLVKAGHELILWTMRSGKSEKDAELWFRDNNIPLWSIGYNPTQDSWTTSNKAYAQLYIDDAALGCPLIYPKKDEFGIPTLGLRPFVDWIKVEKMLIDNGILNDK